MSWSGISHDGAIKAAARSGLREGGGAREDVWWQQGWGGVGGGDATAQAVQVLPLCTSDDGNGHDTQERGAAGGAVRNRYSAHLCACGVWVSMSAPTTGGVHRALLELLLLLPRLTHSLE